MSRIREFLSYRAAVGVSGEKNFPCLYKHLSYDYGGYMFVPMEFGQTKMFKGDRGKNKEPGLKARLDSLDKTLEFGSKW